MGTCYAQVIVEAGTRLLMPDNVYCTPIVIALLVGAVGVKAVLYFLCRATLAAMKQKSTALEAQAEDHFNDCITNMLSAIGTFFASTLFAELVGFESSLTLYFVDPLLAALF